MKKRFFIPLLIALALAAGYLIKEVVATSNPHTWTDGLVGYWSFDGQYTTSTAGTRDVSNNGNWGTFNGGVKPVAGISGQALSFDGVDDYVDVGNIGIGGANNITLEAWIKTSYTGVSSQSVISDTNVAHNDYAFSIYVKGTTGIIVAEIWEGAVREMGTIYGTDGNWHHIVYTVNQALDTRYLYVDGILNASDNYTDPSGSYTRFFIGRSGSLNIPFNGLIDEVRVYNRALSAGEVKQHYEQTRRNLKINQPSGTPPVGWWKMDEPTGATVRDYSANANNGTVSNGGYGATSTDGKIGKALNFDGVNDYVSLGSSSVFNFANGSSITLESWVKTNDSTTVANQVVVANRNSSTQANWYTRKSASNGNMGFTYRNSGDTAFHIYETDSAALTSNAWVHLALTYTFGTGSSAKWYVNGQQVAASWTTGNGNEAPYTINGPAEIGSIQNGFNLFWNGLIDEVRIYNYARTADQIAADYRAGAYRTIVGTSVPSTWWTNGLVGYWNFDGKNTTSTAGTRDTSGNNNWGTFNGGVKPVAGISGQALSFDGTDDYISTNFNGTQYSSVSFSFWAKTTALSGTHYVLDNSPGSAGFIIRQETGSMVTYAYTAGGLYDDSVAIPDTGWHFYTIIFTPTSLGIGIDGKPAISPVTFASTSFTAGTTMRIGCANDSVSLIWSGLIDEVRVYNRALGADEIKQHYEQTRRNLGM